MRRIHMIGNAHIDPVWLWQWPEGYQEVRATFQSAIDRMDEYPDFVFTCDSAQFFEWVEESAPDLFEQIRERVAEGRFQVIGGWWVEPDCNIPSGESFVRQALYGQRYLREKLGILATTGANIDSFGHNAAIPQILRGSGIDSYVFLRPGPAELALESPVFWWESPDGSRVLAYRIPHEYCAPKDDLGDHVETAIATLPSDDADYAVFYGVGNHGGGPTRANLDQIAQLNADGTGPQLELSSLRRFFDGMRATGREFPTVRGELQHHARGCYTSHSGIKRWNRRAENALLRAERWNVIAGSLGLGPPRSSRAPGSSCSSTSSTTRSPAPRSSPPTTTPATSSATRPLSRRARSTPRPRPSPGRSRSSRRSRCARWSSSTTIRGRSKPTWRWSTRGSARRARTSSTTRARPYRCR